MDAERMLFTIGQLSRRSGLPVRTIRYWSDIGVLPPAARTGSGRRLYDAQSAAHLELIATLRELGLGLADVRQVLENNGALTQIASVHVAALDAQIHSLRLRRAVLACVASRRPDTKEMALMNRLARLSAAERNQIIDAFLDEVFHGLDADPRLAERLRRATPDLPDDPTREQVDAWVELAELVQDPGFRSRIRAMAESGAQAAGPGGAPARSGHNTPDAAFVERVLAHAGPAQQRGLDPASAEGAEVLSGILAGTPGDQRRPELLAELEAGTDPRAERYWQLLGIINGWPPFPAHVPAFEWMIAALHAHPAG